MPLYLNKRDTGEFEQFTQTLRETSVLDEEIEHARQTMRLADGHASIEARDLSPPS
ncbi:hypothetical protein IDH44_19365 [Paenibacillus sp. IB182496]|uniref:Uncharacterized protein n=1 Tax=Paenibacillus sabuli TaxID=2772509 RepID=A0A927GTI1_9BACL|nr:hypothetical protein [Paenibacillus sabuli]MBD2847366.1 hypothetical protein [Paenibacillus sabuli]